MSSYPPEKPIIKGERDHCSRSCTPAGSKLCFAIVRGNHEWVIEDFLKREELNGVSLASKFTVSAVDSKGVYYETVWKVKAYPHGCEADVKDHLSLFITQVSGPEVMCKYSLALLTSHPFDRVPMIQGQKRGSVQFPIDKRQSSRGWKRFYPLDQIVGNASSMLHDGALIVRVTVDLEMRLDPMSALVAPSASGAASYGDAGSVTAGCSLVGGRAFLTNLKYTDMVLVVKGIAHGDGSSSSGEDSSTARDQVFETEYPCHKFQLARKSDVFDAMFTHKFKESLENRVVISGLDPAAVLEMLRFIYENKVNNLPLVDKCLLEAADMYNIIDLKGVCERSICENMNVDNVSSLLMFAQTRFSAKIKSKCVEFITKNVQAVTHTAGWNDLVKDPAIMTEVVRAMGPRI